MSERLQPDKSQKLARAKKPASDKSCGPRTSIYVNSYDVMIMIRVSDCSLYDVNIDDDDK